MLVSLQKQAIAFLTFGLYRLLQAFGQPQIVHSFKATNWMPSPAHVYLFSNNAQLPMPKIEKPQCFINQRSTLNRKPIDIGSPRLLDLPSSNYWTPSSLDDGSSIGRGGPSSKTSFTLIVAKGWPCFADWWVIEAIFDNLYTSSSLVLLTNYFKSQLIQAIMLQDNRLTLKMDQIFTILEFQRWA